VCVQSSSLVVKPEPSVPSLSAETSQESIFSRSVLCTHVDILMWFQSACLLYSITLTMRYTVTDWSCESQICTIFNLDTVLPIQIIFLSCSRRWAYLSKWRQVLLNGVDVLLYSYVDLSTWQISHIILKQTNYNLGSFNMFNTIVTLQNCLTRELLPDFFSSKVKLHFAAAMFGGKLFRGSVIDSQCFPCLVNTTRTLSTVACELLMQKFTP